MNNDSSNKSMLTKICLLAGIIAFGAVTVLAISTSQKIAALPIEQFKETAENSQKVSQQAKSLIENNSEKIDSIVEKANSSLEMMTRQMERIEKINRFRGGTPENHDDSFLDFAVRMRELLDDRFAGEGYRVSLKRKTANKPQIKLDESETYEVWISQRTGGTTSAEMAAGMINDSKTVLKKLTISGFPRPGDNRFVIWHPDQAELEIVELNNGETEADGPMYVLDWLAAQDKEAHEFAGELAEEQ